MRQHLERLRRWARKNATAVVAFFSFAFFLALQLRLPRLFGTQQIPYCFFDGSLGQNKQKGGTFRQVSYHLKALHHLMSV